jgi:hypothetical protein
MQMKVLLDLGPMRIRVILYRAKVRSTSLSAAPTVHKPGVNS